jgi:hypothetical protein
MRFKWNIIFRLLNGYYPKPLNREKLTILILEIIKDREGLININELKELINFNYFNNIVFKDILKQLVKEKKIVMRKNLIYHI